jgi:diguanylate cyclase (GGDEF)-like protein
MNRIFYGIYLVTLVIAVSYMAVYAYFYLDIEIRHRNRMLKKTIEDAICIMPSVFLVAVAFVDKTQIITIALVLLYLMALYIDNQNELISLDPLTRLNNRNELTGYLWYKLSTPMRGRICLLMMDMNRFKSINDTYGHVEGDQALIAVASCLKKACGGIPGRPFIARYGGDEFIVVMETESDLDVEHLCDYIHMTLAVENHRLKKPYNLSISIGWVRNEQNNRSIKKLLRRADIELYEKKRQFKERERTA